MAPELENIILAYIIVNRGAGSRVLHEARKSGLAGGTVLLGRGTIKNPVLEALALDDVHKEIVFLMTEESAGIEFLDRLSEELKFHKRNHGIAFIMDVAGVFGSKRLGCGRFKNSGG